ncbi:hypothetical protein BDD14_2587 [Edaphobacter modestus]|uniref:Uncharacterized protein n=1 Tax=Edaphobacter modestus TaxID=388466 RepID=A0A4Q7YTF7_9BACT|nr:hypothetical protein BDD14_2587 [Edaphobacter modestus]
MPQPNQIRRAALSKPVQLSIFQRDGWLCRWCNKPVIFARAMKFLELELRDSGLTAPLAYYHAHWTGATAPLLDELGAVLVSLVSRLLSLRSNSLCEFVLKPAIRNFHSTIDPTPPSSVPLMRPQ